MVSEATCDGHSAQQAAFLAMNHVARQPLGAPCDPRYVCSPGTAGHCAMLASRQVAPGKHHKRLQAGAGFRSDLNRRSPLVQRDAHRGKSDAKRRAMDAYVMYHRRRRRLEWAPRALLLRDGALLGGAASRDPLFWPRLPAHVPGPKWGPSYKVLPNRGPFFGPRSEPFPCPFAPFLFTRTWRPPRAGGERI